MHVEKLQQHIFSVPFFHIQLCPRLKIVIKVSMTTQLVANRIVKVKIIKYSISTIN